MRYTRALTVTLLTMITALVVIPTALAETYVAGIEPSFPPWAYMQNGQYKGITPDAVRAIAKNEGFDVKFTSMPFPSLIPALAAGKIDILVTELTVTTKRAKRIDYTIPYWEANLVTLVRRDKTSNIVTALCCNHDVGAQTGSTEYEWVENHLVKKGIHVNVKTYAQDTTALQDLIIGRLQATFVGATTGQEFVNHNRDKVRIAATIYPYPPHSQALGVQKGDPKHLLPKLNKGIMQLYKSGQWADIVHRYIPGQAIIKVPAYMSSHVYHKPIPGLNGSD